MNLDYISGCEHPAEVGHSPSDDAVAFCPKVGTPLPRRPREVWCELLAYGIPLSPASHKNWMNLYVTLPFFMKVMKPLVSLGRTGQLNTHLTVARILGHTGTGATISMPNMWKWARARNTEVYKEELAKEALKVKVLKNAPDGFGLEAALKVSIFRGLQIVYAGRKRKLQEESEAKVQAIKKQIIDMEEEGKLKLKSLADEFAVVKGGVPLEEEELNRQCADM